MAIKEGRLFKRGSVSWKTRYFVLRDSTLSYYAKAGDDKPRGELPLDAQSEVIDYPKRPYSFQLICGEKSLTVAASSSMELAEWRAAIDEELLRIQTGGAQAHNDMQIVSAAGQDFEMSTKYEIIKAIGHGAYGVVISAHDHSRFEQKVAIKKIPDTFEDLVDAKRIVREIHLLRTFDHPCVISVVDLFTPQPHDDFSDVYIVSDLMETDLHRLIYSRQPLVEEQIQYLLYQSLCGLNYIHSAGVVHRDLKPSNILLNSNCDLKLCDFGLSRGTFGDDDDRIELTEYVVTRWYRAPEIMLSCPSYDSKIDVWSIGCIFGEMLGRKPMFPGSDYIHQLKLIMKIVGTPNEDELWFVSNQKARKFVLNLPKYEPVDLITNYPKASEDAADLLRGLLTLNPANRTSVTEALAHPYFKHCRDEESEGLASQTIDWGEIETCELSKKKLQKLLVADFMALEKEVQAYCEDGASEEPL